MGAIKLSHNLHTPMYFFLCDLSFSETCTTMVVIPRMLVDLLSESKTISLPECATQMFFFLGFASNNCFIMDAMSYDRYTAIRNPLQYHTLMTRKSCLQMMMASWMVGFLFSLCIIITVFNLSFCDLHTIQHYFCDISPVVSLACNYTSYYKMTIFVLSAFVLVGSFILIMISYVFIVFIVIKMPSSKGRSKAFSACSSHLTVVSIHYGFAYFVYLRPKNSNSFHEAMLMAMAYTILTPLLNPIVYSLRNKEMQIALRKALGSVIGFFPKKTKKGAPNI
nr:olfactory receptor 10Z1-like [Callithrix jacchus]XP_054097996.1 olfactory receptor 10Z1-like [Callithrix jacchus]XP_054097997.1 olfactory receptor 10Z1-like [Callithrix jacchus]XP_054097998.1 olfactory receptor 10Z1-like [Callithrix jacchus]XP_054097999.1 olfactory receptor 10Z1-like [Callithrix jacchus]XP_054098000.1 olfactory receptor 10Z1-like [Callithrix jacchus]